MKRPAFTFLELLIALSLFSVGMISVLQIFPLNRKFLAQSAFTTQASFLAQEQVENVRGVDYDSLTAGTYEARHALGATASDSMNQFERQTVVSLINGSYTATTTDIGLKKIFVTVYWNERTISRNYSITTYAANR